MDNIWLISNSDHAALLKNIYTDRLIDYFKIDENKKIFENFDNNKNNPLVLVGNLMKKRKICKYWINFDLDIST